VDRGLLPYDIKAQVDALAAAVDQAVLVEDGLSATVAESLSDAVSDCSSAAGTFVSARGGITGKKQITPTNRRMMKVAQDFNCTFSGLSVWDYTRYPLEQSQQDLESLIEAMDALQPGRANAADALQWMEAVDLTWHGSQMSQPAYRTILAMRSPDYYRLNLALLGRMPAPIDIIYEYGRVKAGDYTGALAGLQQAATAIRNDMNESLFTLTQEVQDITSSARAMTPS